jgi:FkbH-like protein
MSGVQPPIEQDGLQGAWVDLLLAARGEMETARFQSLCRQRRRLLLQGPPTLPAHVRVALLSGATTTLLEEPLQLALEANGVGSTLHGTAYNTFVHEMLDPDSDTVRFRPDVAVVVTTPSNLLTWPSWDAGTEEVEAAVAEASAHWIGLCNSLHEHAGCEIILSNFHPLPLRPLGTAGVRRPGEPNRFLQELNAALARNAPAFVHIHDVATLASFHGVYRWFDTRFWHLAKQPVSFDCLVPYVRNVAQIITALRGRSSKCVVLDLDNTLWGGVLGDDGAEGLVLGAGDPLGEAFAAFQRYLLRLKERGVLLAVNSKNDRDLVLSAFRTRPEMVLRVEDFAVIRANWEPKSDNLREIGAELNIGLDALVFVDDNPAEREQVRRALPEVRVLELGTDPSDYATALDRTGWLDTAAITHEDLARTSLYAANAARSESKITAGDYNAYIRSLEQRATIAPFERRHLERITQLTNKTNQFHLTGRRMTQAELEAMMTSPDHITAYVRLLDRFGDNGLISVFAAHADGEDLWIDLWLMSCRVFNRGVEQALCNYVVEQARPRYRTLHGLYVPTGRNSMVRDHYGRMGFSHSGQLNGAEHWILDATAYQPLKTEISMVAEAIVETGTPSHA